MHVETPNISILHARNTNSGFKKYFLLSFIIHHFRIYDLKKIRTPLLRRRFEKNGLPGGNRTHNRDLGGPRYIHLTTGRKLLDFRKTVEVIERYV